MEIVSGLVLENGQVLAEIRDGMLILARPINDRETFFALIDTLADHEDEQAAAAAEWEKFITEKEVPR